MLCIPLLGPLGLRCQEKARIHELQPGLPPGWQESSTWTIEHCFPGTLTTSWIGSKVVRTRASTPLWKVGVPSCFVGNFCPLGEALFFRKLLTLVGILEHLHIHRLNIYPILCILVLFVAVLTEVLKLRVLFLSLFSLPLGCTEGYPKARFATRAWFLCCCYFYTL